MPLKMTDIKKKRLLRSFQLWSNLLVIYCHCGQKLFLNRPLTFATLVMTWVESVIMGYSGDERQSAVMSAALVP